MNVSEKFLKSLTFPRVAVDFSNDTVSHGVVLLSKNDLVTDNQGNAIKLFEGLRIYAYEENSEWGMGNMRDDIIANGVCEMNRTGLYPHCKWVMRVDSNGIHYMSDFKN